MYVGREVVEMPTIQELRAVSHAEVDAYWNVVESAKGNYSPTQKAGDYFQRNPIEKCSPETIQMAIGAGWLKGDMTEASIAINSAYDAIRLTLSSGRVSAGVRNSRPDGDKDTFLNNLGENNTQEAAFALMTKKLTGVDASAYNLISYDGTTGKMVASARCPHRGFVGIGTVKGGWSTVGSITDKIKTIVNGKDYERLQAKKEEVVIAS
jgi:hypothetical protein